MAKKATEAAADAVSKISEPVKKAGKKIKDASAAVVKNTAEVNVKVIDHAETNAREAFAAMRAAAQADSVKALVKIQSEFVKDQSKRSVAQAKEMGEMIARFGKEAMQAVRSS